MAAIDATARIADGATIGEDVSVGPYCVIGPDVVLGDRTRLVAHVHLTGHCSIGADCVIAPFASLGTAPQSVSYRGGPTKLMIGARCDIREGVTMNVGTEDGGGITRVGDGGLFMVGSHVAHDCIVGNHVTLANNAMLGGHVEIGDHSFLGGGSGVHQFVRIGVGVMISGMSGVTADVIPFGFVVGHRAVLQGLNVVGLRRRGSDRSAIQQLLRAYRTLFLGEGVFRDRLVQVERESGSDPFVRQVLAFIHADNTRPLMHPARTGARGDREANLVS